MEEYYNGLNKFCRKWGKGLKNINFAGILQQICIPSNPENSHAWHVDYSFTPM